MAKAALENSYRNILKGISVFGGVQVVQILANLLRGKFVAIFLGPVGMGMSAMYVAASTTIQKIASCGLGLAIVKEVAARKEDEEGLKALTAIVSRLLLATALLGALVCIVGSRWLSDMSFGNSDYTLAFMLLGAVVFFNIAGTGMQSVLQGVHDVKRLSRATIVGSLTGLITGVPLYWLFGNAGIVPAMLILAVTLWAFYTHSVVKSLGTLGVKIEWRRHKALVWQLFFLGAIFVSGEAISSLCTYVTTFFVREFGNLRTVGIWQAASSLTTQYSAVVFASMAMDYLPRLAAVASSNRRMTTVVNRQIEVMGLLMAPLAALLIICAPLVVTILLTEEFRDSILLIRWFSLGLVFKALMFPLGYVTFAKDNKKVFFWLEGVAGNVLQLVWSCLFFYLFGLDGLGYAMVCDCAFCVLLYYLVNRRLYGYRLNRRAVRSGVYCVAAGAATLAASYITDEIFAYGAMAVCTTLATVMSAIKLRPLLRK